MEVKLQRNNKTGYLEAWKGNKKIGTIITMGDVDHKVPVQQKLKNSKNQSRG